MIRRANNSLGKTSKTLPARNRDGNAHEQEAALIGQILAGGKDLFNDLVEPHLPGLFRFVRSKMQNDPEVDDVVQQTILKAYAGLDRFRFEASFRTWLIQIATNEFLRWRRRSFASRLRLLDPCVLVELYAPSPGRSPLEEYEQRETAAKFDGMISKLPKAYQAVIRLRDYQSRSVKETAERLGLSVSAVRARHWRARRRLAIEWSKMSLSTSH